ncbi:hypothetical protein CC1G_05876 [Coprinopsis cinerea okayama7|uniref:Uncharacterized protein n=1 Tax=Coprinopsis cinerea (strain Okayama-7 / 130 / ATCC MYA-4618 / FGSC 9003) TaxID=240176 RepID=A8NAC5_COPC7|nr:hypothetical protein CC1G_05876 [Coprinopsis cinerea okayama7\|eukprot:XP_001831777.2 hypothetical protein CC1G_05876 [Coprinopsis cinerea okayama7\
MTKAQDGGQKALSAFWVGIHTRVELGWPTPADELKAEQEAHAAAVSAKGKRKTWRPVSAEAYAFADAPSFDLAKWKKDRRQRVSRWFYNTSGTEEKKKAEIKVELNPVPPGQPSRALTKQQLYSKRYYKKRVKKKVRAEFAKLGHPPTAGERISIIHRVTEECWKNETPETKAEIEELEKQILEEREKRKEVLANVLLDAMERDEESPETYIRNIEVLKEIFNGVLSALAKKTGWSFTVLCGGPDPMKNDGEIRTVSYHEGRNVHGLTFNKAHPTFHDTYIKPFSAFLHMIYPEDVRRARDGEASDELDEAREEVLGMNLDEPHEEDGSSTSKRHPGETPIPAVADAGGAPAPPPVRDVGTPPEAPIRPPGPSPASALASPQDVSQTRIVSPVPEGTSTVPTVPEAGTTVPPHPHSAIPTHCCPNGASG